MSDKMVKLSDLKEHISCYLCKGYLTEATTIIECLHTFCKSCIIKYLSDKFTCPKCHNVIHPSHPLQYIAFDRTMQDIVSKLIERPKEVSEIKAVDSGNRLKTIDTNGQHKLNYHREDEQINLIITPDNSCELRAIKHKYVRLSCLCTVTHLKKFLATKLFNDIERYKELDLFCNNNLLGRDHNFKFISVTEWREKVPPVKISYKLRIED